MSGVTTHADLLNVTTGISIATTVPDYWPDFGALQYLEVIYLTIITVLGTIGNLVVIFSIALERRVHAHGNIFIINLAVADLIVSSLIVPTVIANVVKTENALGKVFCDAIGYLVTSTCTCSLFNLMCIALNRFWAVVRPATYQKTFSRKRVYYMAFATWFFSTLFVLPTVLGWGDLKFDGKMMVCSWDDEKSPSYTYFITAVAILIPMLVIAFCYYKLFTTVRGSGKWVRSLSVGSGVTQNSEQNRRSMKKERSLLRTLLTTVLLFCVCWVPFAACVLINPGGTPKHAKKIFGWLALTNSCVNFIIYGAMNPVFRRGYHNLFVFIFHCKRLQHVSSTALHGSLSDSFRSAKRGNKLSKVPNGNQQNRKASKSDTNKENSRVDTITAAPHAVSQITQTTMPNDSPLMLRVKTLTEEHGPLAKEGETPAAPGPAPQKKGFVESIRRASLLRKSTRTRANTTDSASREEERQWRAKRNNAMLLQLQMGDEAESDKEELARMQDERYSRRAASDIPASMSRSAEELGDRHENTNSNKTNPGGSFDGENVTKGSLRRNWMPDNAVYTSKGNTPILQRLPSKGNAGEAATLDFSGSEMKANLAAVSGELELDKTEHSREENAAEAEDEPVGSRGLSTEEENSFLLPEALQENSTSVATREVEER